MVLKGKYSPVTLFTVFLIIWGILNLLQAFYTPLNPDEAYYWMYSRYPAWGYYDHPPMIAMMIRAGYLIISNKLGLRLFVVMFQLLSFFIIWLMIDRNLKNNKEYTWLLILLLCSSPVLNIYGFIATPDSPLLFFEVLFLFLYKKFSQKNSWEYTVLLGITMAAIMYSKYHGAILLILVILSDLKLLRNNKFYAAVLIAILLYIPHVYWQYSNGFPSFKYHLSERVLGFNIIELPKYLLNTLLIHNPLILPIGMYLIIRLKKSTGFERTLIFIVAGTLFFFLLSSFRYRVEPHWTAIIAAPLIIIILNNINLKPWLSKYLKTVTVITLFIFIFIRIVFIVDFIPLNILKTEYHGVRRRMKEIEKIAGDRPVVFTNSYQNPSLYTFHTKKFSHSLDNLNYRKTQFDLWNFEELVHGKDVLYVPHYLEGDFKKNFDKYLTSYGDTVFAKKYSNFQSLQKECCIIKQGGNSFSKKENCSIELILFNPYPYTLDLKHETFPVSFSIGFFINGIIMYNERMEFNKDIRFINPGDSIRLTGSFRIDEIPPGKFKIAVCTESGIQYIVYNSRFRDAIVSE